MPTDGGIVSWSKAAGRYVARVLIPLGRDDRHEWQWLVERDAGGGQKDRIAQGTAKSRRQARAAPEAALSEAIAREHRGAMASDLLETAEGEPTEATLGVLFALRQIERRPEVRDEDDRGVSPFMVCDQIIGGAATQLDDRQRTTLLGAVAEHLRRAHGAGYVKRLESWPGTPMASAAAEHGAGTGFRLTAAGRDVLRNAAVLTGQEMLNALLPAEAPAARPEKSLAQLAGLKYPMCRLRPADARPALKQRRDRTAGRGRIFTRSSRR